MKCWLCTSETVVFWSCMVTTTCCEEGMSHPGNILQASPRYPADEAAGDHQCRSGSDVAAVARVQSQIASLS
jgi:hypothetical protein